jgi:MFS transporter, DHA1 family, staphyloferrin A biosynthesis exporter
MSTARTLSDDGRRLTTATADAGTAAEDRAGFGRRTFAALRYRDFALLWASLTITASGQWLQQITLSWLVFDMTGSALHLGTINGLRMLPFLFTSLFAGVLADRLDRRRLMMGTQFYLVLITLLMAVLLLSGRAALWHLYVFTFVSGLGWSFTMPVRSALVPVLVPRADLMNAIALSSATFNIARVIGPAIGGVLLATMGGGGNFLVQACLYAVVIGLVAMMRVPAVPAAESGQDARPNMWASLLEGLRYIRGNRLVVTLLLLSLVSMLVGMPYQSLLPMFAKDVHDIGSGGLGLLMACSGFGAIVGTLAIAGAGDFPYKGRVQLAALGATGVALALFSQTSWLPLALLFLMLVGGFQMVGMTLNQTLIQTSITDDMRGRVSSVHMLDAGLMPLGSLAAGALAQGLGAPATVTLMGALLACLAALALMRLPILGHRQVEQPAGGVAS